MPNGVLVIYFNHEWTVVLRPPPGHVGPVSVLLVDISKSVEPIQEVYRIIVGAWLRRAGVTAPLDPMKPKGLTAMLNAISAVAAECRKNPGWTIADFTVVTDGRDNCSTVDDAFQAGADAKVANNARRLTDRVTDSELAQLCIGCAETYKCRVLICVGDDRLVNAMDAQPTTTRPVLVHFPDKGVSMCDVNAALTSAAKAASKAKTAGGVSSVLRVVSSADGGLQPVGQDTAEEELRQECRELVPMAAAPSNVASPFLLAVTGTVGNRVAAWGKPVGGALPDPKCVAPLVQRMLKGAHPKTKELVPSEHAKKDEHFYKYRSVINRVLDSLAGREIDGTVWFTAAPDKVLSSKKRASAYTVLRCA
jgi:hypothetical protein